MNTNDQPNLIAQLREAVIERMKRGRQPPHHYKPTLNQIAMRAGVTAPVVYRLMEGREIELSNAAKIAACIGHPLQLA